MQIPLVQQIVYSPTAHPYPIQSLILTRVVHTAEGFGAILHPLLDVHSQTALPYPTQVDAHIHMVEVSILNHHLQ